MSRCSECSRELKSVEIALTKKLVNRGATEFLCKTCLAGRFRVSEGTLDEKAREFRDMGCLLFTELPEGEL
ncbi:MAG: hypothetical protein PHI27_09735 [Eubacteriales bacterium]|nr:hypothetical protein [Eubacteriales bacterium]MDD3882523.1 hypothetical protein [Eubacteriales bacterium]MDD4512823.1 hypothetical protein [Eubacteriales bacterium]